MKQFGSSCNIFKPTGKGGEDYIVEIHEGVKKKKRSSNIPFNFFDQKIKEVRFIDTV